MSRKRKIYPRDTVLFISSSVQEGLPFIPCILINAIMEGIIARAQSLYGQELIAYCFMANHLHLMIRVTSPKQAYQFVGFVKSESAKAINQLLGRGSHTVWQEGFDSPIILTSDKVIEKIVYIYLNPVKARLVNTIDEYPGLSSWKALTTGKLTRSVKWIRRATIKKLAKVAMTYSEQLEVLTKLRKANDTRHDLTITPYKFIESFKDMCHFKSEVIEREIVRRVRTGEDEYKKLNPDVMGVRKITRQAINAPYDSKRAGQHTIFLSSDIDLRVTALTWHKYKSKKAKAAWETLQYGLTSDLPAGFYGPGGICRADIVNFMDLKFDLDDPPPGG